MEIFYSTGARVSEIASLDVSQVDCCNCVMKVKGKGKKERYLPIGRKALQAYQDYQKHLQMSSCLVYDEKAFFCQS